MRIVIENSDQGYYTSINKRTIFTAEALAVSKALKKVWLDQDNED